jgi:hypothetical protein
LAVYRAIGFVPTGEEYGLLLLQDAVGGTQPNSESLVFSSEIKLLMNVPFGQGKDKGKDHAEGMTLFSLDGNGTNSVLK